MQAKLSVTPNMTRVMTNSPAVLNAYLSFSGALAGGSLNAKLREQIAVAVGEQDSCQYCVSAHTAIGKMTGLSGAEIEAARNGKANSSKTAAALTFAREIVAKQPFAPERIQRLIYVSSGGLRAAFDALASRQTIGKVVLIPSSAN